MEFNKNKKCDKKKNIYDILYISDSSDSDKDDYNENYQKQSNKNNIYCITYKKKILCHNSYRNEYNNIDNNIIDNNILLLENSVKNIQLDISTNDKNKNIKLNRPKNIGCGIYY